MDRFNKKIVGALLGVVVILGAVIFWWQYQGGTRGKLEVPEAKLETGLDLEFLDSEMVENRTRYGSFPIESPDKGRDNPFEPY